MASSKHHRHQSTSEPYTRLPPLTVKVIGLKESPKVTGWHFSNGTASPKAVHNNLTAAVCDGTNVFKFVIFESLASQMKEGKTYTVRNFRITTFGTTRTMLSSKDTAVYVSAPIQVSQQLEDEARLLLGPPTTLIPLSNVSQSHMMYVTVKGWVTAMEPLKKIQKEQNPAVPLQIINLKEDESEVKVALWGEAVLTPVCIGSPVEISHLRGNDSQSYGFALHTSPFTVIKPGSGIYDIKPIGYRTIGQDQEVLDSNDIPHIMSSDVWIKVFPDDPEILPSVIQLNYEKGIVTDILMPEE
ncbi:hypothetical protein ACER0C_003424 [Sarotherodon galilaeus]